jgi:hypothetical protein
MIRAKILASRSENLASLRHFEEEQAQNLKLTFQSLGWIYGSI